MTPRLAKQIFIWSTAVSAGIFLVLTVDSLRRMPDRTGAGKLTRQVAWGKQNWQRRNCNDCHTILGIGGYYAPDLTKVASHRDAEWLGRFLTNPQAVWPTPRRMPRFRFSQDEKDSLVAFLGWVNGIDTNGWPPSPLVSAASGETGPLPGEAVYKTQGCSGCHAIGGIGGKIGPDLAHLAGRRNRAWIEQQLKDPRSHDSGSIMPSFASLPYKELQDLLDYLMGFK